MKEKEKRKNKRRVKDKKKTSAAEIRLLLKVLICQAQNQTKVGERGLLLLCCSRLISLKISLLFCSSHSFLSFTFLSFFLSFLSFLFFLSFLVFPFFLSYSFFLSFFLILSFLSFFSFFLSFLSYSFLSFFLFFLSFFLSVTFLRVLSASFSLTVEFGRFNFCSMTELKTSSQKERKKRKTERKKEPGREGKERKREERKKTFICVQNSAEKIERKWREKNLFDLNAGNCNEVGIKSLLKFDRAAVIQLTISVNKA